MASFLSTNSNNNDTPAHKIIREKATAAYDRVNNRSSSNTANEINALFMLNQNYADQSDVYKASNSVIDFMVQKPENHAVKNVIELYNANERKIAFDKENRSYEEAAVNRQADAEGWSK